MGASGAPEAVGPLLGHLDDPSVNVRAEVAQALARIGDSRQRSPSSAKLATERPRCGGRLLAPSVSWAIRGLRVRSFWRFAIRCLRCASKRSRRSVAWLRRKRCCHRSLARRSRPRPRCAWRRSPRWGTSVPSRDPDADQGLASEDPTTPSSPVREALEIERRAAIPHALGGGHLVRERQRRRRRGARARGDARERRGSRHRGRDPQGVGGPRTPGFVPSPIWAIRPRFPRCSSSFGREPHGQATSRALGRASSRPLAARRARGGAAGLGAARSPLDDRRTRAPRARAR